jgi:hypothetical protein
LRSELYDFTVRVLAIPDDETLISSLHFSGREIDALFQLGVEIGRKKSAWIRLPRGGISAYWSPLEETTAGAAAGGHSD